MSKMQRMQIVDLLCFLGLEDLGVPGASKVLYGFNRIDLAHSIFELLLVFCSSVMIFYWVAHYRFFVTWPHSHIPSCHKAAHPHSHKAMQPHSYIASWLHSNRATWPHSYIVPKGGRLRPPPSKREGATQIAPEKLHSHIGEPVRARMAHRAANRPTSVASSPLPSAGRIGADVQPAHLPRLAAPAVPRPGPLW